MTTISPKIDTKLTALFDTRALADRAVERLRASGIPRSHIEIAEGDRADADEVKGGVVESVMSFLRPEREHDAGGAARDGGILVTAHDISQEHLEMAARLFKDAGAIDIHRSGPESYEETKGRTEVLAEGATPDDPAYAPRRVQPGFADAAPGVVPEQAEFSTGLAGDRNEGAEELREAKGRFATQLDNSAEGEGGTRAQNDRPADREPAPSTGTEQANPEQVPPGTPGSGENICRECGGSGRTNDRQCPACGGSGIVTTPIGGA